MRSDHWKLTFGLAERPCEKCHSIDQCGLFWQFGQYFDKVRRTSTAPFGSNNILISWQASHVQMEWLIVSSAAKEGALVFFQAGVLPSAGEPSDVQLIFPQTHARARIHPHQTGWSCGSLFRDFVLGSNLRLETNFTKSFYDFFYFLWAGISQSVQRLATGWWVWWWNPGHSVIFRTRPDRPWGLLSLLYNGYRVSFPGIMWRWPTTHI